MLILQRAALTTFAVLSACLSAMGQEELTGKVIGVTDGDTIEVLIGKTPTKIRLEGIDAPEQKQRFGDASKRELSRLVFGKTATVLKTGQDNYGRVLGFVVADDVEVNQELLRQGWAWHFKEYNTDKKLAKLEQEAREAKRGLWTDDNPISPWDFRDRQKQKNRDADPQKGYWLNTKTGTRHNSSCEFFHNTESGKECGADEGKPCHRCGG